MKIPAFLRKHAPKIESIDWNEPDQQYEVWLHGWSVDPLAPCHFFAEDTLKQVKATLEQSRPCDCAECIIEPL